MFKLVSALHDKVFKQMSWKDLSTFTWKDFKSWTHSRDCKAGMIILSQKVSWSLRMLVSWESVCLVWSLGFDPQHCINQVWWCVSTIPGFGRWREEDWDVNIIFCYILSSRPAWDAWDFFSKKIYISTMLIKKSLFFILWVCMFG